MTYYWSLDREKRRRASVKVLEKAVFIVHEKLLQHLIGWSCCRNSWSGPQYRVTPDAGASRVLVERRISRDAAVKIFFGTRF